MWEEVTPSLDWTGNCGYHGREPQQGEVERACC